MRTAVLLVGSVMLLSACGSKVASVIPGPSGSVVTADNNSRREPSRGPRALNGVPPGHYPPAGQCRLWYSGRPPGQQPKATACKDLAGRVPAGAFVLHNTKAWDMEYDWRAQARRQPGSVPDVILQLLK